MSGGGQIGLVRDPRQASGATFLELFFDLAFVFAFTRLSQELHKEVSWYGVWDTLVSLLALWWVWSTTVWLTERLDPERLLTQLVVIVIMFWALVIAAAVPDAFEGHGTVFAIGYVTVQLVRGLFMLVALRGHPLYRSTLRSLAWTAASGVLWVIGGPVDRHIQEPLWTVAVIVDYVAAGLGWPLPGKGRATHFNLPVGSEHLAERYRQFLIIALGDMVLVTASTFSVGGLTADRWAAFISAFITTVLFWRIYIYRAGELLGHAIAAADQPTRSSQATSYAHLVMVIGIVLTTVANELTIDHPFGGGHVASTVVVVAGPAVFLLGRALFELTVFGRMSRARLTGIALILALFPLAQLVPLVATTTLVDLVLLAVAVTNAMTWRYRPVRVRGSVVSGDSSP
jgi:low temperature requirement protein LtrA